jgi:predicted DNA-binding transcriptional regulator AlpA
MTNAPGDLAYLPPEYRGLVELRVRDLCAIFRTSRETIRVRCKQGKLPAPVPDSEPRRPRWSAAAISAHLAKQVGAQ